MPIVRKNEYHNSYVVYDAPVDEKTKELRKKFDIDDETGYPRMYNWRALARLGPVCKPEDPFLKFGPYNPEEQISTKVFLAAFSIGSGIGAHWFESYINARPFWTRSHRMVIYTASLMYAFFWIHEKTLERQGIKNAIAVDYLKKHPERFGPIQRPKYREVLFEYIPIR